MRQCCGSAPRCARRTSKRTRRRGRCSRRRGGEHRRVRLQSEDHADIVAGGADSALAVKEPTAPASRDRRFLADARREEGDVAVSLDKTSGASRVGGGSELEAASSGPVPTKLDGAVERDQGALALRVLRLLRPASLRRKAATAGRFDAFAYRYNHHGPHEALATSLQPRISTHRLRSTRVSHVLNSVTTLHLAVALM